MAGTAGLGWSKNYPKMWCAVSILKVPFKVSWVERSVVEDYGGNGRDIREELEDPGLNPGTIRQFMVSTRLQ